MIFAVGALIALHGIASIPLDGHEALVAQTAQEMHDRDLWVVPYYNGEPRLAKPPLNYWLTRVIATAAGATNRIEPWHVRLTSVVSGLALIAIIVFVTASLFDRSTGVVAAALAVASTAFFSGTHDGRSDMLYTLWCATGIAGFVYAWSKPGERAERVGIYGMWTAFGLATLTKGPHVPCMFFAAMVIFCLLRAPDCAAAVRRLRPLTGVVLAASVSTPWWIALRRRIGAEALHESQLSGSLLHARWDKALDPYYLYKPLVYVLPWVVLVPAVVRVLKRRELRSDGVVLLALLYVVPVLALTCGPQKRLIYALPAWVPLTGLIAAATVSYVRDASPEELEAVRRWFLPAHALLAAAAAAAIVIASGSLPSRLLAMAALLFAVAGARISVRQASMRMEPLGQIVIAAGLAGSVFVAAGGSTLFFEETRYEKVRLASVINDVAAPDVPLATLGLSASPYVYYARRRIDELAGPEELEAWLMRAPEGQGVLLVATGLLPKLPGSVTREVLDGFADPDDATTLVRVRRASGSNSVSEQPK